MKSTTPALDPLPNPRHEAFACEIASGRNATQAYINVYATKNRHVAQAGGYRLMRRKEIAARIRALQQAGAARVALDLSEILDFLARVVRTPAGDVLPSSDLCARVKRTRDGSLDVWMPNKLACLRLSAKLQGFLNSASLAQTASPDRPPANPAGAVSPPRTARAARTPAQSGTPEPPDADTSFVLSEELRQILMARKKSLILQHPEEKPPTQEKPLPEEHTHPDEKGRTQQQSRPEPTHPPETPANIQPTHAPATPPASPEDCRTLAGDKASVQATPPEPVRPANAPRTRAERIGTIAERVPGAQPIGTNNPPKSARTGGTEVPSDGRRNPPNPPACQTNVPRPYHPSHLSRVTPDDSSALIII